MHETHRYNTSWEKVRRVFPAGGPYTVLDLGCGDGSLVKPLVNDHDVLGLDINADAIREAYALGVHAVKGSIENVFPFQDHSCDVVLALDILEHAVDMDFIFSEIKRVLKPDGSIIISLPNHFDLRTRLEILFGKGIIKWSQRDYEKQSWKYAHLRFLTLPECKKMLQEFGLYADMWQFNFMSQGLFPTKFILKSMRRWLVAQMPGLFSGKFVVRCKVHPVDQMATIIIDETPKDF